VQSGYRASARWYDVFIEPLIKTFRKYGLALYPPQSSQKILDIGCGTGTLLSLYSRAGCKVFGIDLSPAMLSVAQTKLAGRAGLCQGNGARMPFADTSQDLITAMLAFHEMPASLRSPVLREAQRVLKKEGRLLIIDYHPSSAHFPIGWIFGAFIAGIEFLAGGEHFGNYRTFITSGGLPALLAPNGLEIDKRRIVGGGTIGLYLLRRTSPQPTQSI
jgi:demethylmenaquinone methyltransferase/2-methoxy-6-polyprenyl-1,4-benzoquinol methylase